MIKYNGKQVCEGIAVGRIFRHQKSISSVTKRAVIDIAGEMERLENALVVANEQLERLYDKTVKEAGEDQALIFEIHRMMLEDADYLDAVKEVIAEGINAEYAVYMAQEQFAQMFADMNDGYLKERAVDIKDISQRLIMILSGKQEESIRMAETVILLADDMSPSEIINLDTNHILALVTRNGSVHSHAAILARGRNLPMIVNVQIPNPDEADGKYAAVDGFTGELMIEPEEAVIIELTKKKEQWLKEQQELFLLKGLENVTRDGRTIKIYANIGNEKEAQEACDADAGGIGLFRSEYLYLDRQQPPMEEEQFESYKAVLEIMSGRRVVIRTLDIGGDKRADYLQSDTENNPAMGCRGIRLCFAMPEILMTQLRAIYRASAYGNVAIMFPMIISTDEVKKIKEMTKQVRIRLLEEGYPIGEVPLGIMIETPAAALIADELAKEVDFFSIGTNDLIQYTLAIDRQNESLEGYCDELHPGVLRLIEMTVKSAHEAGIPVGICGELAADTSLIDTFLAMGVDELSVAPAFVLKVRRAVREIE